jgi:hypothetical protein
LRFLFSFVPTGNAVYISGRRPMREIEKKGNKSVVVVVVVASPPTPSYPSQSWRKFFFHYYYVYIRRFFSPERFLPVRLFCSSGGRPPTPHPSWIWVVFVFLRLILSSSSPPSSLLHFLCFRFQFVCELIKKEKKENDTQQQRSGVYRSHSFIAVVAPI